MTHTPDLQQRNSEVIAAPWALKTSALGVVACGLLSLLLALVYMVMRTGFGFSGHGLLGALGFAWCLTNLPFTLRLFVASKAAESQWWRSEGFVTLVVMVLTALVGYWAIELSFDLAIPLFVVGLAAFLWNTLLCIRANRARAAVGFVIAVAIYAVWVAGVEWANGYLSPLYVENLILHGGEGHYDTLFLTSLGNMINTYGVPSTGWDGVPYTVYHFGSSWLFAQWANLIGASVLDFYLMAVPIAIIPLFLRGLLVLAGEVRGLFGPGESDLGAIGFATTAFLIACATIGFLPPAAMNSAGVWSDGPFLSESHVVGMAGSMLLVSVVVCFARGVLARREAAGPSAVPLVLLIVPLGVGALGVIKVSHMLLVGAVLGFLLLRLRLFRKPLYLAGAAILAIAALLVYKYVVWSGLNEGIAPLNFMRELIPLTWWPAFLLLHLFWTWLYALLRLRQESAQTMSDFRALVASRRIVDVEAVLLLGVLAILPGMLFNLRSDAYYFSDVQRWFALAMLLGNALLVSRIWSRGTSSVAQIFRRKGRGSLTLDQLIAGVTAIALVSTMLLTVFSWGGKLVRSNMTTRRELQDILKNRPANSLKNAIVGLVRHPATLVSGGPSRVVSAQLRPLADDTAFARALRSTPRSPIVYTLLEIGKLPVKERRASLIYIDDSLDEYWNVIGKRTACEFSAMVGPTLAATALLDGVPPNCRLRGFYGEASYKERGAPTQEQTLSAAEMCTKAKARGFGRVIAVLPTSEGKLSSLRISCSAANSASAPPG